MTDEDLGGANVITDGVQLTKVWLLHAKVGTVNSRLLRLLLQVCELLAVVLHLEQHESRVA